MAWTAPRTYVANEVVTAAILNTDHRDNLLALSAHAHTGAAGDGADDLSGLDTLTLDDQAANPAVTGRLQRNGADLYWYDGSSVKKITNHTHTPSNVTAGNNSGSGGGGGSIALTYISVLSSTYLGLASVSHTPNSLFSSVGIVATATFDAQGQTVYLRIMVDGVEAAVTSGNSGSAPDPTILVCSASKNGQTIASHTYQVEVKDAGSAPHAYVMADSIAYEENKWS